MTLLQRGRLLMGTAAAVCGLAVAADAAPAQAPREMAALGDSLTVALRACGANALCPQSSWSTGTDPAVDSHLLRLRRAAGGGEVGHNFAVSGRKVADLDRQARQAVAQGVEYVTILIGTNDVCRESVGAMTAVSTFRSQFAQAMTTLANGLPGARVFVASIPHPERVRELFKDDAQARAVWAADGPQGTCAVFLQDATSEAAAAQGRRAAARARLADFNRQLAEVCAQHAGCVHDGGAVFAWDFDRADVTPADYFHFSLRGQAGLAARTFPLAFPASPAPPAVSGAPGASVVAIGDPTRSVTRTRRLPAKLKLRRAALLGGRLDALLGITGRSTGRLHVEYHAGGERRAFGVALGQARDGERRVRLVRLLSAAQRRAASGLVTVRYAGDATVRPDVVRLRAARRPSRLRRTELSFAGGRLRVGGTLTPAARGVVRLRVTYADADGGLAEWRHAAPIAGGRWRADERLPDAASADPDAYLTVQFTGYVSARGGPIRGEQDGKALGGLAARPAGQGTS